MKVTSEDFRADDEVGLGPSRKRESFGRPIANVQDQLCVLPYFILTSVNIERTSSHPAQQYVMSADDELPVFEAHRQTAVAATTRLEEHDRAVLLDKASDGIEGSRSGNHSFRRLVH